jgi:flagella basal body P-ring formation protein FlgA
MLVGALLVVCAIPCPLGVQGQTPKDGMRLVQISLKVEARADGPLVRIGHVAQLDGGDANVREAIARLDLADFLGKDAMTLNREQVKFRLLIAGHDSRSFQVVGAAQCYVRKSTTAVSEETILQAARNAILDRIPEFAKHVIITPACPVAPPVLEVRTNDRIHLQAELAQANMPLGKTTVDVTVIVNGQKRAVVHTLLNVLPGSIQEPGQPGQPAADENPVLVKLRDRVKLTARVGSSQITATGEALQEGRMGESIRIRNLDSNRTVQGRILGPGLIEVDY